MNKLFSKVAALSIGLAMAIGVGVAVGSRSAKVVRAAEDDTHEISDFTGKGVGTVINNGATPETISIADPGYSVKQVIIGWTHNKSNDGVTASVSIGGDSLGSGKVGGQSTTTTTTIGSGSTSLSGDIEITWANGMSGTKKGTLTINSITLVEGESQGEQTYTVTYNANGGTGSMSDETEYSSGDTVTVRYCTFAPADSFHEFDSFNTMADGSGTRYLGGGQFSITKNTTLYAQWNIKDVTLSNGSYSSAVSYVNPMPKELDVKDSNLNKVGLLEVDTSNVTYKTNYSEFDIAANKSLTIKNHSNAVITVVSFEVYKYDNIDVFVDGNTEYMHHGDGSDIGDHTKIELKVNAENTVEIKCNGGNNGSRSQSFYGFEVSMKVGSEVIHPSSVELNAESGFVYIGKTKQLSATVLPVDADDKTVSWSSSNTAVATVSDAGLVTGVAAGSANITATTTDGGLTATFSATVKTISYGTLESPLSVEEARDVLDVTGSSLSEQKLYVKGVVYSSSYDSTHKNFTIWLKNSAGTENKYFELYATTISESYKTDYTSANALAGLEVVCYGYGQIYSTTYELTRSGSDYPEIQVIKYDSITFSNALLSETKGTCDAYEDGVTSYDYQKEALESIWESLESKYNTLSEAEKAVLADADRDEGGSVVEQAMARYDFLTGKYQLDNFVEGRTPIVHVGAYSNMALEGNSTILIVIAIATASTLAFTLLLVFKKRKHN